MSTDEVYGDLSPEDPAFTEQTPYAASKVASDHLVRAWYWTYGLPVVITNCSNNYGPYQFPEKLIALMNLNAFEAKPLPVYGKGENVRDWLYVEDHARALRHVLPDGAPGRTYNIGGRSERTNLQVVEAICSLLDRIAPETSPVTAHGESVTSYSSLITYVADRPGHDQRYAIDDTRIANELAWQPTEAFETGLEKTVRWYLDNLDWVERVCTGAYRDWIETNYVRRGGGE